MVAELFPRQRRERLQRARPSAAPKNVQFFFSGGREDIKSDICRAEHVDYDAVVTLTYCGFGVLCRKDIRDTVSEFNDPHKAHKARSPLPSTMVWEKMRAEKWDDPVFASSPVLIL